MLSGFEQREGGTSVRTDPGGLARSASVRTCSGAGFLSFSCSLADHQPVLVRLRRGVFGGELQKDVAFSCPGRERSCCPRESPTFSAWGLVFLVGSLFHVRPACVCGEGFRRSRLKSWLFLEEGNTCCCLALNKRKGERPYGQTRVA